MPWRDATGRGVRVAIVDSGIHAAHPHVAGVAGGVAIGADGALLDDCVDRLGHGTAVAGAIRDHARDAELYAVKVFDRSLSTTIGRLVQAIGWAVAARVQVVNLSLGTPHEAHAPALRVAIAQAATAGTLVVAAEEIDGVRFYPGSLDGVIPVRLDWTCPRDSFRVLDTPTRVSVLASGYPRSIPGVPPDANLKGISFAVANMTGIVARLCERAPGLPVGEVLGRLARECGSHRAA
jgi:subtilisin family serine protease